jgi:hypothetical protein
MGLGVIYVTLDEGDRWAGHTKIFCPPSGVRLGRAMAAAINSLCGPMAEQKYLGGAELVNFNDIFDAVEHLENYVLGRDPLASFPNTGRVVRVRAFREWVKKPPPCHGLANKKQRAEFRRLWEGSVGFAETIISQHWDAIKRVAAALLVHGTLRQDNIDELLRDCTGDDQLRTHTTNIHPQDKLPPER